MNFENYNSIKVCRVVADANEKIIEEQRFFSVVAHQVYDKREFKLE